MDLSTSVAIIAGLLGILTVFGVVVLVKALRLFSEIQKLVEMLRLQLAPVTHDLTIILADVRSIVRSAEREMDKVGDSISAVRETARNIQRFEALLQERIERPLLDLTAILSALVKGGRVFLKSMKKN